MWGPARPGLAAAQLLPQVTQARSRASSTPAGPEVSGQEVWPGYPKLQLCALDTPPRLPPPVARPTPHPSSRGSGSPSPEPSVRGEPGQQELWAEPWNPFPRGTQYILEIELQVGTATPPGAPGAPQGLPAGGTLRDPAPSQPASKENGAPKEVGVLATRPPPPARLTCPGGRRAPGWRREAAGRARG